MDDQTMAVEARTETPEIISFSREFPPELHVLITNHLDRPSLFSYSLASKAFHLNALHLTWTSITLHLTELNESLLLRDCEMLANYRSRAHFVRTLRIRVLPLTRRFRGMEFSNLQISFPPKVSSILRATLGVLSQVRELVLSNDIPKPLDNGLVSKVLLPQLGFWTATISLRALIWDGFSLFDMLPIIYSSPNITVCRCGERFDGNDVLGSTEDGDPVTNLPAGLLPKLEHFSSSLEVIGLILQEPRQLLTLKICDSGVWDDTDAITFGDRLPPFPATLSTLILSPMLRSMAIFFLNKISVMDKMGRLVLRLRGVQRADYQNPIEKFLKETLNDLLTLALTKLPALHTFEVSTDEKLGLAPSSRSCFDVTMKKPQSDAEELFGRSATLKKIKISWGSPSPPMKRHTQESKLWLGKQGWEWRRKNGDGDWMKTDLAQAYRS